MVNMRKLTDWIKKALATTPPPKRFDLRHASALEQGSSELVARIEAPQDGDLDRAAKDIADAFVMRAQEHTNAFLGPQRFKVVAVGKKGSREQWNFRLEGRDVPREMGESELVPTEKGFMAQLMRHVEVMHRQSTEASHNVVRMLQEENERLREHQSARDERDWEREKLHEQMVSEKQQRDLEFQKFANNENRKDKMFAALLGHVPDIMMRLGSGSKGPEKPGEADEVRSVVKEVLRKMPEDVQSKLMELVASDPELAEKFQRAIMGNNG